MAPSALIPDPPPKTVHFQFHRYSAPDQEAFRKQSYDGEDEAKARTKLEGTSTVQPSNEPIERDRPWEKKTILSIDGGGVRGLSTLLILKALMAKIEEVEKSNNPKATSSAYSPLVDCSTDEDFALSAGVVHDDSHPMKKVPAYRPCHYFDFIGGSGTGGLIALMLGRFRMSIDEAFMTYKELYEKIEGGSSLRAMMNRMGFQKEALTGQYERFINALHPHFPSPQELKMEFKSDSTRCKTIICSIQSSQDKKFKKPFLFRSYEGNLPIWEVARATIAAPFYLEPVNLGDEIYYEAAAHFHNPALYILDEVMRGAQERPDAVDILVSIGTGDFVDEKRSRRRASNTRSRPETRISDSIHKSLKLDSEAGLFNYRRLDVNGQLHGKRTISQIVDASTTYLKTEIAQNQLHVIAINLVNIRLRRARTMRWERFATGIRYQCPIDGCPKPALRFEHRGDLMDHLREIHDKAPPDSVNNQLIQRLLDKGRTNSG